MHDTHIGRALSLGVQLLAQGDMWTGGAGDQIANHLHRNKKEVFCTGIVKCIFHQKLLGSCSSCFAGVMFGRNLFMANMDMRNDCSSQNFLMYIWACE